MRSFQTSPSLHPPRSDAPPLLHRARCLLSSIRNRLTALKKNRGEFIKPSDVNQLYQMIVKQGRSPPSSPSPRLHSQIQNLPCQSHAHPTPLGRAAICTDGNTVWPPASCIARRCCHAFASTSNAAERSPRRSHHLQQPAGHDPRGRVQPPLAFLPHHREDARMPGYVQPDCEYAGESLTLFFIGSPGMRELYLQLLRGANGPTLRWASKIFRYSWRTSGFV